jgi:hypothetical protein
MRRLPISFTVTVVCSVALILIPPGSLAEEAGCKHDMQCKGERICEKGVCVSPLIQDLFPGASTPRNRRVIKTTQRDCENKRGQHRPIHEPDAGGLVRCLLPAEK